MCWTHQIASCHQPCCGGFTAKITSSPSTVCMVNHATEDLQHRTRLLQISLVALPQENGKSKGKEKTQMVEGMVHRVRREKHKSNDNTGWQDGVLHM